MLPDAHGSIRTLTVNVCPCVLTVQKYTRVIAIIRSVSATPLRQN